MSKKRTLSLKSEFRPRNSFQDSLVKTIRDKDVIIAEGPAGVGKTFASAGLALKYLSEGKVDKIIIARPMVAVDEDIGYLPGTAEEKVDPYLRPLFDAFSAFLHPDQIKRLLADEIIEIGPIGFMRGRTFTDSFVILDEAQNATKQQMKMFLTRAGDNVKYIVQGDASQSDLNGSSGFKWVIEKLDECNPVGIIRGNNSQVIRSDLVREMLKFI